MPLPWEEIVRRIAARQEMRGEFIEKMRTVAEHYEGDWLLPVPGTENALTEPLGPALIGEAIDTTALHCSDVLPDMVAFPLELFKSTGKGSADFARRRKLAVEDTWRQSQIHITLGKMYRHLVAYAGFAFAVEPNLTTGRPRVRILDPLMTYPEERSDTDFTPQGSVAFVYSRSGQSIVDLFPAAARFIGPEAYFRESIWDVAEWYDDEQIAVGVLGMDWASPAAKSVRMTTALRQKTRPFLLSTRPQPLGRCPIVTGGAVSLTRAYARLANFTTQVETMARITQLVLRAAERSVFPDRYIIGKDGETPVLVGGSWKEGTTGDINLVAGAQSIGEMRATPDPVGMQMVDRLERNFRVSLGQTSLMSGEQQSNALRTGRAIDSLMGAAVDKRIAELQRIMAVSLTTGNDLILDAYKRFNAGKTIRVQGFGRSPHNVVDLKPTEHIESTVVEAVYPFAGSDLDAATIRIGQMVGTEMISKRTARRLHPMVEDADGEEHSILAEQLEMGLLQAYMQQSADPTAGLPLVDQARIAQLVLQGSTLIDAINKVHDEAQKRQATLAPPPQPGQVAAPEAQPGLGVPGQGQEQPVAPPDAMQQTTTPLQDFKSLVQAARVPYGGQTGPLG